MKLTEEQELEILCQWVEEVPLCNIAGSLNLKDGAVLNFLKRRLKISNPGHWGLENNGRIMDVRHIKARLAWGRRKHD